MSKKICVVGTGYVGLIAAVGLSDFGNMVHGVDIDEEKIRTLSSGKCPIYEPGVEEYLERNLKSGRLVFSTRIANAIRDSEVVLIAVGTPPLPNGEANLSFLEAVVDTVGNNLEGYKVIATKSTVPVGTNRWIKDTLVSKYGKTPGVDFDVVSNPEFLREGKATQDFFHPDRTVVGHESDRAKETMFEVYRSLNLISVPFVWCSLETAELIKYASNAFLATKITFINEMANLAEEVGADIHQVARSMGMDGRIGGKFLHPGPGYGGSCFPKDTQAIAKTGEKYGMRMSLVEAVIEANERQKKRMVKKFVKLIGSPNDLSGKVVTLLGLAFKQDTDDVRDSPAIAIASGLLELGASLRAHDPQGAGNFAKLFPTISYYDTSSEAVRGSDAVILTTEWNEYRSLDLKILKKEMRGRVILDTRNLLNPSEAIEMGFKYEGVGRGDPRSFQKSTQEF